MINMYLTLGKGMEMFEVGELKKSLATARDL